MKNHGASIILAIGAFLIFMECWLLFHHNHKYKVETDKHTSAILWSDNEYEEKDRVIVSPYDGDYHVDVVGSDTVTITKVLR